MERSLYIRALILVREQIGNENMASDILSEQPRKDRRIEGIVRCQTE